jgi:hypothetical protein
MNSLKSIVQRGLIKIEITNLKGALSHLAQIGSSEFLTIDSIRANSSGSIPVSIRGTYIGYNLVNDLSTTNVH